MKNINHLEKNDEISKSKACELSPYKHIDSLRSSCIKLSNFSIKKNLSLITVISNTKWIHEEKIYYSDLSFKEMKNDDSY